MVAFARHFLRIYRSAPHPHTPELWTRSMSSSVGGTAATSGGLHDVVIASCARTAIGSFGGALSSVSAVELGAAAIAGALSRANVPSAEVDACIMGNVLSAAVGQAPARQAALRAGLPERCVCTTVNKVCASGLKAVTMAVQEIQLGLADVVVAGGMESMTQAPHYIRELRFAGARIGDRTILDGMLIDGLIDPGDQVHMGNFAEHCASSHSFSRAEQDAYAIESYQRARAASKDGLFKQEIVPVTVKTKAGSVVVDRDEEHDRVDLDKLHAQRPAFVKDGTGTVTAGNASPLSDGAAALVLMSATRAQQLGVTPLARIIGYADAERCPSEFTIAPASAIPLALKRANLTVSDVDLYEINEAFSVVALANLRRLKLDPSIVNIFGGAVSLGHPLGCSGARILVTLLNALQHKNSRIGTAAICNGGGGSTAVVLEAFSSQSK